MIKKFELYLMLLVLAVLAVLSFNWAMKGAIHYQKDVIVPDLTGKPLVEALDILSSFNLGLKKDGAEQSENVPAGTVLRQMPSAGTLVRENKIIRIVISQGNENIFVPELIGQSLRSAEITLRSTFLSLGEISLQPSLKYGKDTVITQEPPAKAIVARSSLIHLTVSDGPPKDGTILMPDFAGKTKDEAENWSKDSGIKLEFTEDQASPLPAGNVSQQDIQADSVLQPGSTVKISFSSNKSGAVPAKQGQNAKSACFHFEVPQSDSPRKFAFVLVDSFGSREIWRGELQPGSKNDLPLPPKVGVPARVRIFVDGILTEERNIGNQ